MKRDKVYNIVEYINVCVSEFAKRFNLTLTEAYSYLRRFAAISFLIECYDAEHTLSIDEAIVDMKDICLRNGGRIV